MERQIAATSEGLDSRLNRAGMTPSELVEASRLSEFSIPFWTDQLDDSLEHSLELFSTNLHQHRPAMGALRREIDLIKLPEQRSDFVEF